MRRMILATLALFPVLAHAQAGTLTETSSPSSAVLQAEAKIPAAPAEASAGKAAAAGSIGSVNAASETAYRESVQAQFGGDFLEASLRQGGTLEYSFKASAPAESAPKVTRAVEVDLSPQELSAQPAVSNVVVRAIVDENGIPRNVTIKQSDGSVVDKKAVAAVSQYRFKPAMVDNQPTWAAVSISIKIQKQQ